LSKSCQKSCQKVVKKLSKNCQKVVKKLSKVVKKLSKSCQKCCQKVAKVVKKLSRIGCESKIVDHVLFLNKVWGVGWVGRVWWEGKKWFQGLRRLLCSQLKAKSLVKFVDCFKSYELREGSTVIEVIVAKTVRLWKFGFCRDMSLDLGALGLRYSKE
jgi:hypothetical protein